MQFYIPNTMFVFEGEAGFTYAFVDFSYYLGMFHKSFVFKEMSVKYVDFKFDPHNNREPRLSVKSNANLWVFKPPYAWDLLPRTVQKINALRRDKFVKMSWESGNHNQYLFPSIIN